MMYSSSSLPAGMSATSAETCNETFLQNNGVWICLFSQPSGNTGPEQHSEESRAPFVQLLQALCLGLHERTLQSTQEQRRGFPLPTP